MRIDKPKTLYWLLKIGVLVIVLSLPSVAIYGLCSPWAPASKYFSQFKGERPVMFGLSSEKSYTWQENIMKDRSYVERSYILYPSVVRTMKIITIRQLADNSVHVTESRYTLPFALVVYMACILATRSLWFRRRKMNRN